MIAAAEVKAGMDVTVAALDTLPPHKRLAAAGVRAYFFKKWGADKLYFSWAMLFRLPALVREAECLHLHGGWSFPLFWGVCLARLYRRRYLWSAHGSLGGAVLKRYALSKRLLWRLWFRSALLHAAHLHACSAKERDELAALLGEVCPPITVIPDGVDGAAMDAVPAQPRTRTFLFMGRLHPLKGLDILEAAWRLSGLAKAGWQLHIAGPLDGAVPPEGEGITYLGMLEGEARVKALKSAWAVVLPSRSENFGLVVAEALWCETPVITTRATPWHTLGEWCLDLSEAPETTLAEALCRMAQEDPERLRVTFAPHIAQCRATLDWQALTARLLTLV